MQIKKNFMTYLCFTDKVMMKLIHGTSINISLDIVFPANIVSVLQKHFRLNLLNNHTTDIILQSAVDIEQIYLDTVYDIIFLLFFFLKVQLF